MGLRARMGNLVDLKAQPGHKALPGLRGRRAPMGLMVLMGRLVRRGLRDLRGLMALMALMGRLVRLGLRDLRGLMVPLVRRVRLVLDLATWSARRRRWMAGSRPSTGQRES